MSFDCKLQVDSMLDGEKYWVFTLFQRVDFLWAWLRLLDLFETEIDTVRVVLWKCFLFILEDFSWRESSRGKKMSIYSYSIVGLLTYLAVFSSLSIYFVHGSPVNIFSDPLSNSNEERVPLLVFHKNPTAYRFAQQPAYHIRPSRNSWFRASTYQHMKPTNLEFDEKSSGDNVLRWGWQKRIMNILCIVIFSFSSE